MPLFLIAAGMFSARVPSFAQAQPAQAVTVVEQPDAERSRTEFFTEEGLQALVPEKSISAPA